MNKFLIIPDSFKGTLSASEVCHSIAEGILHALPDAQIKSVPAADGGEGTVDALLSALSGKKQSCIVSDPLGRKISASYGILPDYTAVIEMAAAAGLPLLKPEECDPSRTTTYGAGELIADALSKGCRKILLGLGGSSTNDFGCGAACALGAEFYDQEGNAFLPTGGTLDKICSYNLSRLEKKMEGISVSVICDIDNPPCGEYGAAFVFAPQKGADSRMVRQLDDNLCSLAHLIQKQNGTEVQQIRGGGAAGAMGAGMAVFLKAELRSGIDALLDLIHFEEIAAGYDCIFTGEGNFDEQSLSGKVCIGIARRAKPMQIPVIVLAGGISGNLEKACEEGITAAFSINRLPQPLAEAAPHSKENLAFAAENIVRMLNGFTRR